MNGLPNSDQFVFNDPFRFYDDVGSVFAEWLVTLPTGSSISVLYTLTGSYEENDMCTKKMW